VPDKAGFEFVAAFISIGEGVGDVCARNCCAKAPDCDVIMCRSGRAPASAVVYYRARSFGPAHEIAAVPSIWAVLCACRSRTAPS